MSQVKKIYTDHYKELAHIPTPEQKKQILLKWRTEIDQKAHDYADLVLAHPRRQDIEQLEVQGLFQVFLIGYMAKQGWLSKAEAEKSTFQLSRLFRDKLRDLGIQLDKLNLNFAVILDDTYQAIMNIGFNEPKLEEK